MCRFLNYIVASLLLVNYCFPVIVPAAGNTAPSRVAFTTFPATDTNNEMRGFGAFEAGMALGNGATSCLYTCFFPTSGPLDLRGGRLVLQRDLYLDSAVSLQSTGTIGGSSNAVYLPKDTSFTLAEYPAIPFITGLTFSQQVFSVDWSFDSQYIGVGRNSGTGNEIFVLQFNGANIALISSADIATAINAVSWHPSQYYLMGSATNNALGNELFMYFFNPVGPVFNNTAGINLTNTSLANAWNPRGNWIATSVATTTNQVRIYTFNAGALTLLTQATFTPNRAVQRNGMSWAPGGRYLAVGLANSATAGANELNLFFFNDVTLTLTLGANIATSSVTAVDWCPTGSFIAVGLTNGTERLRIYEHNVSAGTLVDQTSAYVGETMNVLAASWSPNGNYLAVGLATGTGTQLRIYQFDKSAVTLSIVSQINWDSNINCLKWSPNSLYLAVGDSNNVLSVYYPVAQPFGFEGVKIVMNSNINLNVPMACLGTVEIEGNDFTLDCSNMQNFSILNNSTLSLKNMTLTGISGTKISNLNSTGVLKLKNVTWIQNGDYTFNNGSFIIDGSVLLTGTSNFIYSSSQTSTILSSAFLNFDDSMTFSYAPSSNARNLIQMIDQSSTLNLLNTSLISTRTGLQLTKGTLVVDGQCPVISEAIAQNQGIMFGDGASSANNVTVKVLPESGLNLNSGYLIYNNV
jgi:WD40 repeat protein